MNRLQAMVQKVYFGQAEFYFSESNGEAQPIQDMHPRHAANAAQKLLREAPSWAKEAGASAEYPQLWMTTTVLFQALTWRAGI